MRAGLTLDIASLPRTVTLKTGLILGNAWFSNTKGWSHPRQ